MIPTEIMDALYASSPLFIDRDLFEKSLDGWEASAVERHNGRTKPEILFVALNKGPVFHFQSMRTGHPLPMREIRKYLNAIIEEHGYAETKTPIEDQRQRRFNELVGFKRHVEDAEYVTYRVEEVV